MRHKPYDMKFKNHIEKNDEKYGYIGYKNNNLKYNPVKIKDRAYCWGHWGVSENKWDNRIVLSPISVIYDLSKLSFLPVELTPVFNVINTYTFDFIMMSSIIKNKIYNYHYDSKWYYPFPIYKTKYKSDIKFKFKFDS